MTNAYLTVTCANCSAVYKVGVDAILTSWDEIAQHHHVVAGSFSTSSPDLVAHMDLERAKQTNPEGWLEVDEENRRNVARVASSPQRQWKCQSCNVVQEYVKPPKIRERVFFGDTSEQVMEQFKREIPQNRVISCVPRHNEQPSKGSVFANSTDEALRVANREYKAKYNIISHCIRERRVGQKVMRAKSEQAVSMQLAGELRVHLNWIIANVKMECLKQPTKGIFGLGARDGEWRMSWDEKGQYAVTITPWPEELTVKFEIDN